MADFTQFLPLLLKFEGGFVDDPADPGGATNKGITIHTFLRYARKILDVEPSLENLKALTDEQAGAIYRVLYWDVVHGDEIASQPLAEIVCDFYVNAGANATKLLQNVMNDLGTNIPVDGGVGPITLQALAGLDPLEVYRAYKAGRIEYYQNLAEQQAGLRKFLRGWLNRVNAFPDL